MKNFTIYLVLSLFLVIQVFPQKYWERRFKTYQNPDELVTMSENLPFGQAIELLSKVSESTTGRRIVSTIQKDDPIGIEIDNMPYDKALMIIVQYAGLQFETKEDVIVVKRGNEVEQTITPETYASINTREVKISAVFFEMDVLEAKSIGISWEFLLSGEDNNIGGLLRTESESGTAGQEGTLAARL